MSSARDVPPAPNPFISAYESFQENTPFVTRMILSVQVVSYLVSWVVDPNYALANIPYFVVFQFEIYRVVLSPLVNTQLITLMFAFLSFLELGKRLEYNLGTVAFGWFCAGVSLITNVAFLFLSLALYALSGEKKYLMSGASGIWLILFGAIAAECIQAPADIKRRFFFCEVPVRYYPLALYAVFAFIGGGPSMAYAISMGVGYLYGQGNGRMDRVLRLSSSKVSEWERENGALSSLTSRPGWVYGHAALGSEAWSQVPAQGMVFPVRKCGKEVVRFYADIVDSICMINTGIICWSATNDIPTNWTFRRVYHYNWQ